jgi:hypothetical protein
MRAVLVRTHGPYDSPRFEDVPDPIPGEREVVIEARAIGVNYPDLLVIEGKYQNLPPRPFTPGKEMAGVVRAVGMGVTSCRPISRTPKAGRAPRPPPFPRPRTPCGSCGLQLLLGVEGQFNHPLEQLIGGQPREIPKH